MTMKKLLTYLFIPLSLLLTGSSCEDKTEEKLYCDLILRAQLPDGRTIVRMEADETLTSTYLRNINNRMEYEFPIFINNQGTVRVQKGVYVLSFDAIVTFDNGKTARVRSSEYTTSEKAINLLTNSETVILNLTLLN